MVKPKEGQKRCNISWEQFKEDLIPLSEILPRHCKIWPIPRNGLIVAAILVHLRPDIEIRQFYIPNTDDIVIDDIEDSGNTLKEYVHQGFETAVVYHRTGSLVTSKYIGKILKTRIWLDFPWEVKK